MKKLVYIFSFILLITSAAHIAQAQTPYCVDGKTPSGARCVEINTTSQAGTGGAGGTTNTGCPSGGGTSANGACNLGYTPLEPIPGFTSGAGAFDPTNPNNLAGLVNSIFKILITVGALTAVLFMTIGGVTYMTSSSVGNKVIGKQRVIASLYGMLIIAAVWLILNTVNPQLLKFSLTANTVPYPGTTNTGSTIAPVAPNVGTLSQSQIQAAQNAGAIPSSVNSSSDTFTFANGSAGNADLNAQYTKFYNDCISKGGSLNSGPQVNGGGTLTSICVH